MTITKTDTNECATKPNQYECFITIGDWSQDGHNSYDVFRYFASHPIPEQQDAYELTSQKTGLRLAGHDTENPHYICVEYKDNLIGAYHIELLRRHAQIDNSRMGDCGPYGFYPDATQMAEFTLWFISVSLPGFSYERLAKAQTKKWDAVEKYMDHTGWIEAAAEGKIFNGWWSPRLNEQIGYGIYDTGLSSFRGNPPHAKHTFKTDTCVKRLCKTNIDYYGGWARYYEYDVRLDRNRMTGGQPYSWYQPMGTSRPSIPYLDEIYAWLLERNVQSLMVFDRVFFESQSEAAMFKLFWGH